MKKLLLSTILLFAISMAAVAQNVHNTVCGYCEGHYIHEGWKCPHCQKGIRKEKGKSPTLYYVVVGSFSSLQEASYYNNNAPGDMEWGAVYKTTANGRTVYRVCQGCYRTKAKAQKEAHEASQFIKDMTGRSNGAWVWPSNTLPTCVEYARDEDGNPCAQYPR